ncbi:MAG: LysR family transcriptional regulator [Geminicoccaceae bacterium]|jgi:LysR family transcriptional activator of nhaA|nr:MAG: LysR family transcriptional regulator [Geminicoccaceae bacterium]
MSLNYHHLRLFRAVALEGNLTRAAQRIGLSPSSLSAQLKALEARLGHRLFERRGRALELSEAGRIALEHAEAIFRTGEDLLATLRGHGRARALLRVGALATLSRNFLVGFLRPVIGRADVEVVIRIGSQAELLRGLESLAFDLVLTTLAPPRERGSRLVVHRLAEMPASLVGTPARLGAPRPALEILLAREPLVLPTPETGLRTAFDALLARLEIRPSIAAEVEDMATMRLLARADVGLALLPPIVVRDELGRGELVEAHAFAEITETFWAVELGRRFASPLVRELLREAERNAPLAPQPARP